MTPRLIVFLEKFIAANHETLGPEAKNDINEMIGAICEIFCVDPWDETRRDASRIVYPSLIQSASGECRFELTMEIKRLSRFKLSHLCWDEKRGWTAHHGALDEIIPLQSLIVKFT